MTYKYLFGPVPSRRLGLSLGVDLVPHKTCSLDCIYCECGETTNLTLERKEYVSTEELKAELNHYFKNQYEKNPPKYFTFSGSGEPTLGSNLGDIVNFIKSKNLNSKICLLTNSTLLWNEKVRSELKEIDLVVPSLDAVLEETYQKINRPAKNLPIEKIIEGLIEFQKEFKGQIFLEIFIIPGLNTSKKELTRFKKVIEQINPDKVQLNSLDRPGVLENLQKAPKITLEKIIDFWNLENVEIVSRYEVQQKTLTRDLNELKNQILQIISRRPCTIQDLADSLASRRVEIMKMIDILSNENKIESQIMDRGVFYSVK